MLDHCSISHKGGTILWSRSFTPSASKIAASTQSPVNALVRDALIEGRTSQDKYEKDGYAIKYVFYNKLELIFVVAYQRILQLTYVDELLEAMMTMFIKLFEPFLTSFVASLHAISSISASSAPKSLSVLSWDLAKTLQGWNSVFDTLLRGFENKASAERRTRLRSAPSQQPAPDPTVDTEPTLESDHASDGQEISRQASILKNRLKGKGPGRGGRTNGRQPLRDNGLTAGYNSGYGSASGNDSDTTNKKRRAKSMRKWGDEVPTDGDMAELDYSAPSDGIQSASAHRNIVEQLVDNHSLGSRSSDGTYDVRDWEYKANSHNELNNGEQTPKSSLGAISSMFARFTGGKTLTGSDVEPILVDMKELLMKKNVAKEIADKVCDGVGRTLIGKKVAGFQSIKTSVRDALEASISNILTPKTSTDMLQAIRAKIASPLPSTAKRIPYSITFVGVNGVGKSTNLSKVCFWLLQNGFRVLIAACDTFRSGAVEQLRVHVKNLSTLASTSAEMRHSTVELYEKGYGKDAAGIAKEAIAYGRDNDFDVVLIDTAGRMQDNEPLMKALAKLVSFNNPDKIIFVGEALVGNEAVDQLMKFDRALRDFSSSGSAGAPHGRGIDGMLVTKWDTVDDKVGAALSMTYVTGQPIYFVGCGQTYTDLRQLRVAKVVEALLNE